MSGWSWCSAADRDRLIELAGTADIVVDGGNQADAFGTSCAELAERFGHLVALSVTDFGGTGPYASWRATDPVLYAMSTALSRTGPTAGTPVLPPLGVASATAAVQAAWAALAAYYHRLRCGTGEYIDFSRFEAVLQSLDPPFGSEGQAVVGIKKTTEIWRGRPRNQNIYPIFACKDGHVRICLLSARQWRGMRRFGRAVAGLTAAHELAGALMRKRETHLRPPAGQERKRGARVRHLQEALRDWSDDDERALVGGSIAAVAGFLVSGLFEYNFGDTEVLLVACALMALPFVIARDLSEQSEGASTAPSDASPRSCAGKAGARSGG